MILRTRVYIAGPISLGDRVANLAQALTAFRRLTEEGLAPLCPQFSALVGYLFAHFDHAEWMAIDLPWLAKADAVLRLPGVSVGADQEAALAESLGIPVFYKLERLLEWNEERELHGSQSITSSAVR